MKSTILASLLGVTVTFTSAVADIQILDNDQNVTVDCAADPVVSVVGNNATITLTGTCKAVSVSGNQATITGSVKRLSFSGNNNTAQLDGADAISVSGNHNTVTWKRGLTKKKPAVSNPGNHNTVLKTK